MPATKLATTGGEVQPSAGPSMMANTTPEIPATHRAKIAGQEKNSSKAPETKRLTNVPAPATPAHTPTAPARSSGGNTLVTIESVIGMIIAAPTPETVLSAISAPGYLRRLLQ